MLNLFAYPFQLRTIDTENKRTEPKSSHKKVYLIKNNQTKETSMTYREESQKVKHFQHVSETYKKLNTCHNFTESDCM